MIGALRSELVKLTTLKLWWILLLALVVYTAPIGAFLAGVLPGSKTTPVDIHDAAGVGVLYTIPSATAYVFALVIGAVIVTGEYSTDLIQTTYLLEPRRWIVTVAKAVIALATGLVYGIVALAVCVGAIAAVLRANGADPLLGDGAIWGRLLGSVLAMALWALIGCGFGAMVRSQVVAIVVLIVFAQFAEPIAELAIRAAAPDSTIWPFLPGAASSALSGGSLVTAALGQPAAEPWQGGIVLAAYAVVLAVVGGVLSQRRDV